MRLTVTVYGNPAPKGSMKCVGRRGRRGHVLVEDNKRTGPWRKQITAALLARHELPTIDKTVPVTVTVELCVPRPAAHYGTGRNRYRLKPSAPDYPTAHTSGDVDKHARTILDALQDGPVPLLADDAAVVELRTRKCYPGDGMAAPGARIKVETL